VLDINKLCESSKIRTQKDRAIEMIHKKNGKFHIYRGQDNYKCELKSHNWVGRICIDGDKR